MAKFDAIKQGFNGVLAKLREKLDRIPFLKKLKEPKQAAGTSENHLGEIYRKGSSFDKIQIFFIYLFSLLCVIFLVYAIKGIYFRIAGSRSQSDLRENYAKGFDGMQDRAREAASVVSLGKVLLNGYGLDKKGFLSLDLWVRCSSPEAAAYAQNNSVIFTDKAVESLYKLLEQKVDFLSDSGKAKAHESIRENMNSVMQRGRIEKVFFHNLVIQ